MSRESLIDEVLPVATAKPIRGREMTSKKLNTDKPEVYHEGYVDGKRYLVPDSNLEAMKDVINLTMRPRKSTRYRHQTSYELTDYDHFQDKLNRLLEKIDEVSLLSLESETTTEQSSSETEEEEKVPSKEESTTSSEEEEEVTSEEESSETVTTVSSEEEKKPVEEEKVEKGEEEPVLETVPVPVEPSNEFRIRFLISGHFKNGNKPMYMIHDYDGKLDLFKDQKADFVSVKKTGAADVFIYGRTYTENILFELEGKPDYLNIKPYKLYIRPDNCKIFYDYFESVFPLEVADLTLKGEFIRTETINKITPLLAFGIIPKEPHSFNRRKNSDEKQQITAYYASKPRNNPLSKNKLIDKKNKGYEENGNDQDEDKNLEKTSTSSKGKSHFIKDIDFHPPKSK